MFDRSTEKRIHDLASLIGSTPLVEIGFRYRGEIRKLYAKAEYFNFTGSIKDRMALHIVRSAYRSGRLKPGDRIVEATSGNTGISFAAIGRSLGHPVTIFMPDWMSDERKNLIRSYGAEIVLVSREQGGFLGCIRLAEELAGNSRDIFLPCQFTNTDNIDAHILATGPETWLQLQRLGLRPDAVAAGVGTGGTIMGLTRYLRQTNTRLQAFPVEPASSPTLSTGHKVGRHRMQGISDEFIPAIVHLEEMNGILAVDDGDAIIMAQRLAAELGLGVGISSGGNFLGALMAQNRLGQNAVVVTAFPDDNKKYLSTDLMKREPVKDGFLSTDIELVNVVSHPRANAYC